MKKEKSNVTSICVDLELVNAMRSEAKDMGVSFSSLARDLFREFLARRARLKQDHEAFLADCLSQLEDM